MRDPKFVLVANESTWLNIFNFIHHEMVAHNNDFMRIWRAVKKIWASLY